MVARAHCLLHIFVGLSAVCLLNFDAGAQTVVTATYIGPSGGLWNAPSNWSNGVVPRNTLTTQYDVVIPSGRTVSYFLSGATPEINSLSLGAGSLLSCGGPLTVLGDSAIHGNIETLGSTASVRLLGAGTVIARTGRVRVAASGSSITIGSSTIDWRTDAPTLSFSPLSIDSPNSSLRLPNLTVLDAAFNDANPASNTVITIGTTSTTSATGLLYVPELTAIHGPNQRGDAIRLSLGGGMDAPLLAQISGNTIWTLRSNVTLPSLTQLSNADIEIQLGQFRLPAAQTLQNVRVQIGAATNALFSAPLATAFTWAAPAITPGNDPTFLSIATNAGVIDLSNVRTFDLTQDLSGGRIDVRTGSILDLSRLTTINGPAQQAAPTNILIGAPGLGTIRFNALSEINGNVTLTLSHSPQAGTFVPELSKIDGATLRITNGATFESAVLTSADNSTIVATELGTRVELPGLTTIVTDGTHRPQNSAGYILQATRGGVLVAPNLRSVDASYDDGGAIVSTLRLSADIGSVLRLPKLGRLIAPVRPEDRLELYAESGGRIELPALDLPSHSTVFLNNGTVRIGGDLRLLGDANITGSSSQHPSDTFLSVAGSFVNQSTNDGGTFMNQLTLQMIGAGDSTFEVGSRFLGLDPSNFAVDHNFNVGVLQIGDTEVQSRVFLIDQFDNTPGSGPEALYLRHFQASSVPTSLRIRGNSELWIGNIAVYARINGVMVELRSLIPIGSDRVRFDQGWIVIPAPSVSVPFLAMASFAACRRRRAT